MIICVQLLCFWVGGQIKQAQASCCQPSFSSFCSAPMDSFFLREQPVVSLTDSGMHRTFMADVVHERPAFHDIKRWSEAWSPDAVKKIEEAMKRKNCAVSWIQFVVDQHGLLVILRFKHPVILGAAKTATQSLLRCLPDEATQVAATQSLRPLDEVDATRIRAWQTVASTRPRGEKRARARQREKKEAQSGLYFLSFFFFFFLWSSF